MDRETADEIKRHFNVVAEGLRSEIRLLADGVAANNERLDRFEVSVGEFRSSVTAEFKSVHLEFGSLRTRLESLQARFGS